MAFKRKEELLSGRENNKKSTRIKGVLLVDSENGPAVSWVEKEALLGENLFAIYPALYNGEKAYLLVKKWRYSGPETMTWESILLQYEDWETLLPSYENEEE